MRYRTDFFEGHGLRSDPDPYEFEADDDIEALQNVFEVLDIPKKGNTSLKARLRKNGVRQIRRCDGGNVLLIKTD